MYGTALDADLFKGQVRRPASSRVAATNSVSVSKLVIAMHMFLMHISPAACAPARTWRWGRWWGTVGVLWGAPNEWGIH